MAMVIERFDIWLARHESDPEKVFPCLVVSPDELNRHVQTVIVAPITRNLANYPTRIDCQLANQSAKIALDQITTINKSTLTKKLGTLPSPITETILEKLAEVFAS